MLTFQQPNMSYDEFHQRREELELSQDELITINSYICDRLLDTDSQDETKALFQQGPEFKDFKRRIIKPQDMLTLVDAAIGKRLIHPGQLDINIADVEINSDETLHDHSFALAVAHILGNDHGYDDPIEAFIYHDGEWKIPQVWETYIFPKNMRHWLKRSQNGLLTFLTSQSAAVETDPYNQYTNTWEFPLDYREILNSDMDKAAEIALDIRRKASGSGVNPAVDPYYAHQDKNK